MKQPIIRTVHDMLALLDELNLKKTAAGTRTAYAVAVAAEGLRFPEAGTGPAAIYNALSTGDDPLTSQAVTRAAIADQITGYLPMVVENAKLVLTAAAAGELDEMIAALKPTHDKAGAGLAADRDRLNETGLTLEDAGAHASTDPSLAELLRHIGEGTRLVDRIGTAIAMLSLAVGPGFATLPSIAIQYDITNTPANKVPMSPTPWRALEHGLTISLATPDDARARARASHDLQAAQDLQQEQNSRAAAFGQYDRVRSIA
jgi:hypothetical protein